MAFWRVFWKLFFKRKCVFSYFFEVLLGFLEFCLDFFWSLGFGFFGVFSRKRCFFSPVFFKSFSWRVRGFCFEKKCFCVVFFVCLSFSKFCSF